MFQGQIDCHASRVLSSSNCYIIWWHINSETFYWLSGGWIWNIIDVDVTHVASRPSICQCKEQSVVSALLSEVSALKREQSRQIIYRHVRSFSPSTFIIYTYVFGSCASDRMFLNILHGYIGYQGLYYTVTASWNLYVCAANYMYRVSINQRTLTRCPMEKILLTIGNSDRKKKCNFDWESPKRLDIIKLLCTRKKANITHPCDPDAAGRVVIRQREAYRTEGHKELSLGKSSGILNTCQTK